MSFCQGLVPFAPGLCPLQLGGGVKIHEVAKLLIILFLCFIFLSSAPLLSSQHSGLLDQISFVPIVEDPPGEGIFSPFYATTGNMGIKLILPKLGNQFHFTFPLFPFGKGLHMGQ